MKVLYFIIFYFIFNEFSNFIECNFIINNVFNILSIFYKFFKSLIKKIGEKFERNYK